MTLRARLLLSALILSLTTTIVLSLIVRDAWQQTEAAQFEAQFDETVRELSSELGRAAGKIGEELGPLCAHEPVVDSALVGLQGGTLTSRLVSIRARIPSLRSAMSLDELALVGQDGSIIAGSLGEGTYSESQLAQLVVERSARPGFQTVPQRAFVASCLRREGNDWVALVGLRYLDPLLAEASSAELRLSISETPLPQQGKERPGVLLRTVQLDFLDGIVIQASRSRLALIASLRHLDFRVLMASAGALFGALLLAFFLSKGLARPVVQFAERTRAAVTGTVEALPVSGGPELEQAARAFNATLDDLKILRERLRATERIAARREVARQIAHEIKNPLSPIRTSIETLRKLKERKHPEFDNYFEESTTTVLSEVRRISNLVSSFSEYARLPSPVPSKIDLAALTRKMVGFHQDLGANIEFFDEGIPEVMADPDQIAQVITNLLKNAIEATITLENPRIELSLQLAPELTELASGRRSVELSVSDNGPGVMASAIDRLFEPYATTKEDGTGLGLPISQRIAVEHGGDLTYTTRPEGGARFILHLPTSGPPKLATAEEKQGERPRG